MGSLSIWHWLIIAVVVLVAFGGAGKIPRMMGDMAKGIKAFKKGMSEDDKTATVTPPAETKTIDHQPPERVTSQQPESHKAG